jgi:hypothetical protein
MVDTEDTLSTPSQQVLRAQIGWLCQFVRFSALAYAALTLVSITSLWLDPPRVAAHYGHWLRADISGINGWQRLAGFGIHFCIWLLVATCVYSAWRLFSGFLAGRIFTLDAVIWLRRTAVLGLVAQIADVLTRPLVTGLATLHLPKGARHLAISFNQVDLVLLMFLAALVALAHIFKTAAAIAADNEAII